MKKNILKKIRRIASTLPAIYYHTNVIVPGYQIPLQQRLSDHDDNKRYIGYKAKAPVNHTRRLKKAYEKGGWEAVLKYAEKAHSIAALPQTNNKT